MNRWITCVLLGLVGACQAEAIETSVESAASSEDCVPGGNYIKATLPALPMWNGSKPIAKPGQMFLDVADWRVNTQSSGVGFHVGVLVDPGAGTIVWGATVPDQKLGSFRGPGTQPSLGDCCRPPPCGCRGCCDNGLVAKWMARNLLEAALRAHVIPDHAAAAAGDL